MPTEQTSEPLFHARRIRRQLVETAEHIRIDLERVEEPRARALLSTARDVLVGLIHAFQHYERTASAPEDASRPRP